MESGSKNEQLVGIHSERGVVFGGDQTHVGYVPAQTVLHLPQSQNIVQQLLVACVNDLLELGHECLSEGVLPDCELLR